MTDQQPTIFRPEALEHRSRRTTAGAIVRLAPPWTTAAFYALLVLFVAAVVAASVVEIDRYATGTTVVDEGRVVVLLPASLAPDVSAGSPVELGDRTARVDSFRNEILYPSDARELYGVETSVPSVAVVTDASTAPTQSARVLVESDPVIVALIPGLEPLLGGE